MRLVLGALIIVSVTAFACAEEVNPHALDVYRSAFRSTCLGQFFILVADADPSAPQWSTDPRTFRSVCDSLARNADYSGSFSDLGSITSAGRRDGCKAGGEQALKRFEIVVTEARRSQMLQDCED